MNEKKLWAALACGLLALSGCSGRTTVNPIGGSPSAGSLSGEETGGNVGSGGEHGVVVGAGTSAGGAAGDTAGASPEDRAGTWTGHVDDVQFSDGSNAITLILDRDGTGRISFGNSPEPPPPSSDPNLGYPERRSDANGQDVGASERLGRPLPGFLFTIQNVATDGSRLQFDITYADPWRKWCQLQTSFPADGPFAGEYYCVPRWESITEPNNCSLQDPMTLELVPIDCTKLHDCQGGVCACTAEGCSEDTSSKGHFDLELKGSKANGSAANLVYGSDANLQLTKQPP